MALSVGSRLPGVTWHLALWSPDFPPPSRCHHRKGAIAWPTPTPILSRSTNGGRGKSSLREDVGQIQTPLAGLLLRTLIEVRPRAPHTAPGDRHRAALPPRDGPGSSKGIPAGHAPVGRIGHGGRAFRFSARNDDDKFAFLLVWVAARMVCRSPSPPRKTVSNRLVSSRQISACGSIPKLLPMSSRLARTR